MQSPLPSRIDAAIRTAKTWDKDPSLLAEIRASIPMMELVPELCSRQRHLQLFLSSEDDSGDDGKQEGAPKIVDSSEICTFYRDDDLSYEGDDLLLKRLTLYFKEKVMKWVNQPPCSNSTCAKNDGMQMKSIGVRGPLTNEEKRGEASRVEVYACQICDTETTFPRYNSPRALFRSRRGRCGEFANLFGTYCRSLGFDTRYISDFTDHVWVEVWSVRQQRWIHADSCEGLIDRPNMYEQGWGKKLNYIIGATSDSVVDVTKRYTRKFHTDDFQARRREISASERTSENIFIQANNVVKQMSKPGKGRLEELEKRERLEVAFFGMVQSSAVWDKDYREGRISGSLAWKAARSELGDPGAKKYEQKGEEGKLEKTVYSYLVESFYSPPRDNEVTIVVKPPSALHLKSSGPNSNSECIVVNGVPCAATLANGISVVIVDDISGCILQSQAFLNWSSAGSFLDTVPDGRVVAICSTCVQDEEKTADLREESTTKHLSRIGGINVKSLGLIQAKSKSDDENEQFVLFIGQVGFHPKWATFVRTINYSTYIQSSIRLCNSSPPKVMLRSEPDTVPSAVSTRLPEYIMPLKTQLLSSHAQKRTAFQSYIDQITDSSRTSSIVGYVTKSEAPVYLIENHSFPFRQAYGPASIANTSNSSWVTYHFLPDALVPENDFIEEDSGETSAFSNHIVIPKFDIPVADDYFVGLLGDKLLINDTTKHPLLIDTSNALANSRLIALYFSASWCLPCRQFTPNLIEFYKILVDVAPTHGMEIIFVSSDRDESQFEQYYKKMPFKAIPFSNRQQAERIKSMFGIQGIPSLVVLDSLSGRMVAAQDECRGDVIRACRGGEPEIVHLLKRWFDKVPEESKAILATLALSCEETNADLSTTSEGTAVRTNAKAENYLSRKKATQLADNGDSEAKGLSNTESSAARVKELFSQLISEGLAPNAAAAKAIEQATAEQRNTLLSTPTLDEGTLSGNSKQSTVLGGSIVGINIEMAADKVYHLNSKDRSKVAKVLSTAKKYVSNVQRDPSNPRFRTFRLSNKVFDQITTTTGGVDLLACLGFAVFHSDVDFVASIPLFVDLDLIRSVLDKILKSYTD